MKKSLTCNTVAVLVVRSPLHTYTGNEVLMCRVQLVVREISAGSG